MAVLGVAETIEGRKQSKAKQGKAKARQAKLSCVNLGKGERGEEKRRDETRDTSESWSERRFGAGWWTLIS